MLIEFLFKNYRSFRDEAVLSMEATGLGSYRNALIDYGTMKLLPSIAIFGKNGGGKSNVIRAFWLAVQFIRNAQRTQYENAEVPVNAFLLNDYSKNDVTAFSFIYTVNDIKYWYEFSATKEKVYSESLYSAPKGQKAKIFSREGQNFSFTTEKTKRNLISEAVAPNQLFFSVACTMNDAECVNAMRWFRDYILFSRDYSDIPAELLAYSNDSNMLKAISDYAKIADVGIEDIHYEFNNEEIDEELDFPDDMPEGIKSALSQFVKSLSEMSNESNFHLMKNNVKATSLHKGINHSGKTEQYPLDLFEESDGTLKLISVAPAVEATLKNGGILFVDELDKELHPILVDYVVSKFQSKKTNPNGAQLVFTTHDMELLNLELLRKDQIYFVDKNSKDGISELYSISDLSTKTADNIRKGYLLGKYGATPEIEIEEVE